MAVSEDLKERIDMARAREALENGGNTPSRSEWLRDAAKRKLEEDGEPVESGEPVEA
jgi:hypothetical protein